MKQRYPGVVWFLAVAAACGGGDGGGDTPSSQATPLGGVFETIPDVTLSADPTAVIYYTLDGSEPTADSVGKEAPVVLKDLPSGTEVRFFARGETTMHSETYVADPLGPTPVSGLAASLNATAITLSWDAVTAPGVVVLARGVPNTEKVAAGALPAVGESVAGAEVVYVGNDTSFVDSGRPAGLSTYTAWVHYPTLQFSGASHASARVAAPPTPGSLSVDIAAGTVTFTPAASLGADKAQQPLAISGGNVVFDTDTVTFDVVLTSALVGLTFNPKIVVTSTSKGTFSNADGEIKGGARDGLAYRYYGPAAVPAGGAVTRSFEVTGVLATDILSLGIETQLDRGHLRQNWLGDIEPAGEMVDLGTEQRSPAMPDALSFRETNPARPNTGYLRSYRGTHLSPDGRFAYAGARNAARVVKVDLTTLQEVAGTTLTTNRGEGAASYLASPAAGRFMYAVLNDGMHTGAHRSEEQAHSDAMARTAPESIDVYLVEIDKQTMQETRRLLLASSTSLLHRGRRLAVSRDGRTVAVATGPGYVTPTQSALFVVDVSAWTIRDGDPSADGIQPFSTAGLRPSQPAFSWDGRYVLFNDSWQEICDTIGIIDLAAESPEVKTHDLDKESQCSIKVMQFLARPDGTLLLAGHMPHVYYSYDPATDVSEAHGPQGEALNTLAIQERDGLLYLSSYNDVREVDPATHAVLRNVATANASIQRDDNYGHHARITP